MFQKIKRVPERIYRKTAPLFIQHWHLAGPNFKTRVKTIKERLRVVKKLSCFEIGAFFPLLHSA